MVDEQHNYNKDFLHKNSSPGTFRPLMAMVEITNRCNMSCSICFSRSGRNDTDISLARVKRRIDLLRNSVGCIPLQISGGEPTLSPYLPEILAYARDTGFKNIEMVTNGKIIGEDKSYLQRLAECGLTAVYLQFDSLNNDNLQRLRGERAVEVREKAITATRSAKLCCTLAVAVTRGVNDNELGDIVRYALRNIDTVRAINFQSATQFTGRFSLTDANRGFSLEQLLDLIEDQCNLPSGGFLSSVLGTGQCNAMSLVYDIDGTLIPLFAHISSKTLSKFLGNQPRQVIADLFMGKEKFTRKYIFKPAAWQALFEARSIFDKPLDVSAVLRKKHLLIFAKSFMEKNNLDQGRLAGCCYGIVDDNGIHSFCAYNNLLRFKAKE